MKKNIILLIILTVSGISRSYSQTPATTPPPPEQNKVADFKILTAEEVEKINAENQKKAEEAQRLADIQKAKSAEKIPVKDRALYFKIKEKEGTSAMLFFDNYLKSKKNAKRILLSGLGVCVGGLLLTSWNNNRVIDYNNYDDVDKYIAAINRQHTISSIGPGLIIGGAGLSLIAIPVRIKASTNLRTAKNMVAAIGVGPNGFSLAYNF